MIAEIVKEFEAIKTEIEKSFGPLSSDQMNWRPNAEGWSVAQCLEHLILTKTLFFKDLDDLQAKGRQNSWWEKWSPLTPLFTKMYFRYIRSETAKVKAPTSKIVPPSTVTADILNRFMENQDQLIAKLSRLGDSGIAGVVVSSPFIPLVTYKLIDGIRLISEHDWRHIRQAKRVMVAEGFPK